jgi:hypothetical protein
MDEELKRYIEAVSSTGFVLEHSVSKLLRSKGWQVINNRYYIDDRDKAVREIDIIAYKVGKAEYVNIFTALIISCKKNEANTWAFFVRNFDGVDPNRNLQPLHVWTNDKALAHVASGRHFSQRYQRRGKMTGGRFALEDPDFDVFAYQEMRKANGSPQNDKNIFASVTSLMKAQAHELAILPSRKQEPSLYVFFLLSVVDTDLIRILFKDGPKTAEKISEQTYIARYIVRDENYEARIRFVNFAALEEVVEQYGFLHEFNCNFFARSRAEFYEDIFKDAIKREVYTPEFIRKISFYVGRAVYEATGQFELPKSVGFSYDRKNETLFLYFSQWPNLHEKFNEMATLRSIVKQALLEIFRYEGEFVIGYDDDIDADIPF